MHRDSLRSTPTRRDFLWNLGGGIGGIALAQLLGGEGLGAEPFVPRPEFNGGLHHPAKVKRIIQLFMNGGASPMDTFDYKPELSRLHGQMLGPKEKPEGQTAAVGAVMKSPFEFKQYGQCGQWVSAVFPEQARCVDEMTFLMAMATNTNVHGASCYLMNTGFLLPGFPCMGSWISYALGSLSDNLPAFIVLPDARGLPNNQKGNFSAGFLPARHQGALINSLGDHPVPDLFASERFPFAAGDADRDSFELLQEFNRAHAAEHPGDSRMEARIASCELAAKMQLSAPETFDLLRETAATRESYGLNNKVTEDFGRRCLIARRLIERGSRVVQVWSGPQGAANNWDNHGNIQTELLPVATSVDKPAAALLTDLKQRGLLDDTLLIWTTEFGRTPFAQASLGRDHNGGSFVTWMAGAGLKPGIAYGRSDDLGFQAVEGKTLCYDLHATILHLLGIDHTKLTFRSSGIDRRLTDVHGHVIRPILA